ncbi:MAG TPA: sorbosone dehydrogenase family protein [Candidatus Paenibacillus intestinavium]|nr:sorbosone dehydrogenase family protein [Candidatus Paenibacillus intestinavium]
MKQVLSMLFVLLLISGCSTDEQQGPANDQQPTIAEQENSPNGQETDGQEEKSVEVIAENLMVPWSIAKLGNTFYIAERPGNIVKIENGEFERQGVELEKELSTASEAGLLGFVLAPDFPESNVAYSYYSYEDSFGQFNRVVTLYLEDGVWREGNLLLDKIPSAPWHDGGRLKIGPDGKLYATTGDASNSAIAQDPNSLGGKILRMNLDGSIPSDNPFPNSYVFSYGHRNPQGIAWSTDDTLYTSEHGNNANDEVNEIEAGLNYGWPIIEGKEVQEGMVSPLFTPGDGATWAPSGMDYFDGKLYVAALRGSAVLEFDLETGDQREVISGLGRVRDVRIEDNVLYFISNNTDGRGVPQENEDKLYKVLLSEDDDS